MPKKNNRKNGFVIHHKEYLGDIVSTGTAFTVTSSNVLSAGNPNIFPWLSTITAQHQRYRFRSLRIGYGSELPTTSAGVVIVSTTDNVNAPLPYTKAHMLENSDCLKTNAWAPAVINCKIDHGWKVCQFGQPGAPLQTISGVSTNVNSMDYSVGRFFVAVSGVAAGTVGEMWIDYVVEFIDSAPMCYPPPLAHRIKITSNSNATHPFDTVATAMTQSGYYNVTFGTDTISFNAPGPFILTVTGGTSSATGATTVSASAGTLTLVSSSIAAASFTSVHTWVSTNVNTALVLTFQSYTNLNWATAPMQICIAPYDNSYMAL